MKLAVKGVLAATVAVAAFGATAALGCGAQDALQAQSAQEDAAATQHAADEAAAVADSDGASAVEQTGNKTDKTDKADKADKTEKVDKTDKVTKVVVSAAGDCTLGTDSAFNYSTSLNAMYSKKGAGYFLKGVKGIFSNDDLTIVNLEGTLTTRGSKADKAFAFRGKPSYTKILTKGSVEAVSFANNHCYDYGKVSYTDTIGYVKKAGIKLSSYSRVSVYKVKGVKIGMVSVDDIGQYGGQAKSLIKSGIKKLKKKNVNAIIVSMHAGIEKDYYPSSTQKSIAHYAVKQGADLVLGHHPHVLQGVEKYKGVYICYSLGNFCFGGNSNPADKNTMIVQKTLTFKDGKLVKDKALKVIPCRVSGHSYYNDYQPTVLGGAAKKSVMSKINSYSKPFGISFKANGKAKK